MSTRKSAKVTVEHFAIRAAFEKAADPSKDGRLARMTYEFETADVLNRNRRIYPESVFRPACDDLNSNCKEGQIYGRLDHPSIYSDSSYVPTMSDAAVLVSSVEMVGGKKVRVVMDVLDNPDGQRLMSCLKAGGNAAISQRAIADWDEPSEEERKHYGLSADSVAQIARSLRLVTYDVVAKPGFATATDPVVTEGHEEDPMWKTADEVKANAPTIYDTIFNAGKVSVDVARLTTEAISAEKPKIIEAATAPLTEKLTKADERITKLNGALEQVKTIFAGVGLSLETVSDKEVEKRLQTATKRADDAEKEAKDAKSALETATKELAALKGKAAASEIAGKIREKYGKSKHIALILEACEGMTDEKAALERAAKEVGKIAAIKGVDVEEIVNESEDADEGEDANEGLADPEAPAGESGKKNKSKQTGRVGSAFGVM